MTQELRCSHCYVSVPAEQWNQPEPSPCVNCGRPVWALVFPAAFQQRSGAAPQAVIAEGEATCFYHSEARASVPCDECGRFLCALCDLEVDHRHVCPLCFQAGVAQRKLQQIDSRRILWDAIALALAAAPVVTLIFFYASLVTSPAALFLTFRHWRKPLSVLPRTKLRFIFAILFALIGLAFNGLIFFFIALRSAQTVP